MKDSVEANSFVMEMPLHLCLVFFPRADLRLLRRDQYAVGQFDTSIHVDFYCSGRIRRWNTVRLPRRSLDSDGHRPRVASICFGHRNDQPDIHSAHFGSRRNEFTFTSRDHGSSTFLPLISLVIISDALKVTVTFAVAMATATQQCHYSLTQLPNYLKKHKYFKNIFKNFKKYSKNFKNI